MTDVQSTKDEAAMDVLNPWKVTYTKSYCSKDEVTMTFLSPLKLTDVPQVHGEDGEYLNMTDRWIASHAKFAYGDKCVDERYGIVTADC